MPPEFLNGILPFILLFVVFYFVLIRPQMQQQKKRKELLESLKEGDKIRTIGGIYGSIEKIKDDDLTVRIADNVRVRMARFGVERVMTDKE
ncbi:MAG: preprotein translocase subunit YajC [Bacillota bacterium]|nr:preprotein translocase subunit YajC [Bacillota bacterium]MDW7684580.1 preprotein translocase subunit YajC [Bacillota bacterium]